MKLKLKSRLKTVILTFIDKKNDIEYNGDNKSKINEKELRHD